jgi:hypothetical protein
MKLRFAWVCVLLTGMAPGLCAAAVDSTDQAELIQSLLARIEQLEKRMVELEKKAVAGQTPVATTPKEVAEVVQAEQPPLLETARGHPMSPSVKFVGFSDFNFSATNQRGSKSGFNEGQFILHLASTLSPKVNFMGEISLTARSDAGTGSPPATGFNAEVERTIIRFEQNDYFKLSFGRFHTPINYWNTAFHHGQWLQSTVSRPEMTQFGGSFIPVHFVGGLIEGALPARGLNLNYNFGVGNGRGSVISRGGDFGDIDNNRAWLVNVFSKPDRLYGLQVGGSVYRDKITQTGGREFREWIQSGHIVWQKENPELIAEFANVTHQPLGDTHKFNSQAWYIQTAYRLPSLERLWKPYYRFEYIHIPSSDPVFRTLSSLAGSVLGIRYDISSFAAIKFEYRNQRRPGLRRVQGGFVQTSFTF